MEFKKKPITIEAQQFTIKDAEVVAEWCRGTLVHTDDSVQFIQIPADNGYVAIAEVTDWIIRNADDSFYFMDAETFEQTYEPLV